MANTLIVIYSILLLVLMILSIFFSSADMAYGSVSLLRLEHQCSSEKKSKNLNRAIKLTKDYDKTISTILLFNDVINVALDTISTLLGITIAISLLNINEESVQESIGLAFSLTMLVLKIIFGEIIAKSLGKIYNYKLVKWYSLSITICYYITLPITFIVSNLGLLITYPVRKHTKAVKFKDDELHEMIDESQESGIISENKANLLKGAIDYASTEIYQIMTPRTKIFAVEKDDSLDEIFNDYKAFNHSKIVVYDDNIDNIIGYITTKSLIKLKLEGKFDSIKSIIIPVEFFPRSTEINDVYKHFVESKVDLAVVLDEYGGTEGILTKEDIIEEIVGEIWDEIDDTTTIIDKNSNGDYIVDGMLNLEDFCEAFNIDFDSLETEYVTIGGFIIELLDDHFAKLNEVIEFKNLTLKVIALGKHHTVKKLLIHVNEEKEED